MSDNDYLLEGLDKVAELDKTALDMSYEGDPGEVWKVVSCGDGSQIQRPTDPFAELKDRVEDHREKEQDILQDLLDSAEEVLELQLSLNPMVCSSIKKEDNKWVVYPKNGGKRLGEHDSYDSALKQLRAIEVNKQGSRNGGWRPLNSMSTQNMRVYQLSRGGMVFRKTKHYDGQGSSEWLLEAKDGSGNSFKTVGSYPNDQRIDGAVSRVLNGASAQPHTAAWVFRKYSVKPGDVVGLKPEYSKRGTVLMINHWGDALITWQDGKQQTVNPELLEIVAAKTAAEEDLPDLFKGWGEAEGKPSKPTKKPAKLDLQDWRARWSPSAYNETDLESALDGLFDGVSADLGVKAKSDPGFVEYAKEHMASAGVPDEFIQHGESYLKTASSVYPDEDPSLPEDEPLPDNPPETVEEQLQAPTELQDPDELMEKEGPLPDVQPPLVEEFGQESESMDLLMGLEEPEETVDYETYVDDVARRVEEFMAEEDQLRDEVADLAEQVADQIDRFSGTHEARLQRMGMSPGEFKDSRGQELREGDEVKDTNIGGGEEGQVKGLYQTYDNDMATVFIRDHEMKDEAATEDLIKI